MFKYSQSVTAEYTFRNGYYFLVFCLPFLHKYIRLKSLTPSRLLTPQGISQTLPVPNDCLSLGTSLLPLILDGSLTA